MDNSLFIALGLMLVVYYFLLIRPQQQRMKKHKAMVEALKKGDRVLMQGGMFGKVSAVKADDNEIEVEIATGVKVKVLRSTVQAVVNTGETPAK